MRLRSIVLVPCFILLASGCSSGRAGFASGTANTELPRPVPVAAPGPAWSAMDSGTEAVLWDVWGSSPTDVFAVGEGGVFHYDGTGWSRMQTGSVTFLAGVWGSSGTDVFAVGGALTQEGLYSGAIIHYDGNSWSGVACPDVHVLDCVWGSSAADVFVAGDSGTVLHFRGATWTAAPTMCSGTSGAIPPTTFLP
jgi:hypothetical protein